MVYLCHLLQQANIVQWADKWPDKWTYRQTGNREMLPMSPPAYTDNTKMSVFISLSVRYVDKCFLQNQSELSLQVNITPAAISS